MTIKSFFLSGLILLILISTACNSDKGEKDGLIKVTLEPWSPSKEVRGVRWSPKGEKLQLLPSESGMISSLYLGLPEVNPIRLRLNKVAGSEFYNQLELDLDRDGEFGSSNDTTLTCVPNESRGKMWSSFSGEVPVPFEKNKYHKALSNPYPLSFWYVYDPTEENSEEVIRFSRRGWMQGKVESDFGTINILITESVMDGFFDRNDSWALAPDSTPEDLYSSNLSSALDNHTWLGEQAFGVDSVLPSGRVIWIKPVDPQITRAEEEAQKDWLAPDKAAKRSGEKVKFLHDYEYAMELAQKGNKQVLLDFETTWCGPCKTMDQWVYTADTIVTATKKIVCVKIDGDEHKDLVKKYNVSGYPTLIVLNADQTEKKRASGYQSVMNTLLLLK